MFRFVLDLAAVFSTGFIEYPEFFEPSNGIILCIPIATLALTQLLDRDVL